MRNSKISTRSKKTYPSIVLMLLALIFSGHQALNAQCSMPCKSVNISVGAGCMAGISPSDLLSDECTGAASYGVKVLDHHGVLIEEMKSLQYMEDFNWMGAGSFTSEEVQVEITAYAADGSIINSCWNYALIEDKLPPTINCDQTIINMTSLKCCEAIDIPMALMREAVDECSDFKLEILNQGERPIDCSDPDLSDYVRQIDIIAYAIDKFGNQTEVCTFEVMVERIFPHFTFGHEPEYDLDVMPVVDSIKLKCPENHSVQGGNAYTCTSLDTLELIDFNTPDGIIQIPAPTLAGGGIPYIIKDLDPTAEFDLDTTILYPMGTPGSEELLINCNIGTTYQDLFLGKNGCVTKIMRQWSIREWHCTAEGTITCNQTIEITDSKGPVALDTVPDFEITTNGYECLGNLTLPNITFTDDCGPISHIDVIHPNGIFENFVYGSGPGVIKIPEGVDTVCYRAYDACHNFGEFCFEVSVWDNTPPVAICDDNLVVSLSHEGAAEIYASSFDDGSYDDCKLKTTVIRKMNPDRCDCSEHPPEFEHFFSMGEYCGHYYYLSNDSIISDKARSVAVALGGYIAVPDGNASTECDSMGEHDWIRNQVESYYGADIPYWYANKIYDTNPPKPEFLDTEKRYYVVELDNPCGFSSSLHFCCADYADGDNMVVLRAIDKWGNFNECMVSVELQDKSPSELECPPNIDVACEFDFVDVTNLGLCFGEIKGSLFEAQTEGFTLTGSGSSVTAAFVAFYKGGVPDKPSVDSIKTKTFNHGYVTDNCGGAIDVTELIDDDRDQCGRGELIREFFIDTDGDGMAGPNESHCTQTLTFVPTDTFNNETIDVSKLRDTTITITDMMQCIDFSSNTENLYPSSTFGAPTFPGEDNCDLLGIQYEDEIFDVVNSNGRTCSGYAGTAGNLNDDTCYKIVRRWSVINWCNLNNAKPGVFEDRVTLEPQIIYLQSAGIPEIVEPDIKHKFCSFDPTCGDGMVQLTKTAASGNVCTKADELASFYCLEQVDGSGYDPNSHGPLSGNQIGASFSIDGKYPVGKYHLNYSFYDKCGNVHTAVDTIVVELCKAPAAYCLNGLSVALNEVGEVELWASDFALNPKAACSGYGVDLSFCSANPEIKNLTFNCRHIGTQLVNIYFTLIDPSDHPSGETRQSFCTATITIQDNGMDCPVAGQMNPNPCPGPDANNNTSPGGGQNNAMSALISGSISRADDAMISDVMVELQGANIDPAMTDGEGHYAFPNMPIGGQYIVIPDKDDDPVEGVSTLDIVQIQKHILGLRILDSPYKIIAADVNNSGSIAATDILVLRRLILGLDTDFSNNNVWNFVDKNQVFYDEENPLNENLMTDYSIGDLSSDMDIHFVGIKTGDVNHSATVSGLRSSEKRNESKSLVLSFDRQSLTKAENVYLPISSGIAQETNGFQFTLAYDSDKLRFNNVSSTLGLTDENFGIHDDKGMLTVSWHSAELFDLEAQQELFTIEFESYEASIVEDVISVNSDITKAEAYANDEVMDIQLITTEGIVNVQDFEVFQNTPNPFVSDTKIGFSIPSEGQVSLTVHTLTGQVLYKSNRNYAAGYNEVSISTDEINYRGALYYTMNYEGSKETKQMIILE